jgi:carboxylesterase type B
MYLLLTSHCLFVQAPQLPEAWEGIYNATVEGSQCPQRHVIAEEHLGNEDCLILNIYTHKVGLHLTHFLQ